MEEVFSRELLDASHIEAPVTVKAYLICAFAAFGGIFGDDIGWLSGVLAMPFIIRLWTGMEYPSDLYPDLTTPDAVEYAKTFILSAHDQS
jgi:hypothetical protein